MFTDFRTVENGLVVESDLCVIGAGAAGITIAREMIGENLRVCLVESGGLDFEADTQSLYMGEDIGMSFHDSALTEDRLRFFGGSTNHWNGKCAPLNELDFQTRPWVPYSGWPISKAELDNYYRRALLICELGPYVFDEILWKKLGVEPPALNPSKVKSHFWQFSKGPTRFGKVYRDQLLNAENVEVLLNANVTSINTDKTGSTVKDIDVCALNGKCAQVKSRFFVLACGALENARLLLISNQVQTTGLGNQHDLVGRFFMDHPRARGGTLVVANEDYLLDVYRNRNFKGIVFQPCMAIGEEVQMQEQVLNACANLEAQSDIPHAVEAGRQIYRSLKGGHLPEDLSEKILHVLSDLGVVNKYLFCRLKGSERCGPIELHLFVRIEQAPNPNSRVTLSQERDSLGLKRLRLDWRLTELEKRTVRALAMAIGKEFGRLNLGREKLAKWLVEDVTPEWIGGSHHHIGTTRMAESPKVGVVNSDCRVHGISNLYIAGSSVFPTSGFVNPTLTIVALALRLADHLRTA